MILTFLTHVQKCSELELWTLLAEEKTITVNPDLLAEIQTKMLMTVTVDLYWFNPQVNISCKFQATNHSTSMTCATQRTFEANRIYI